MANMQEYQERLAMDKLTGVNEKQVGGDHYDKNGEQHWDRIYRLYGRGYFIGCATKYLERYHLKNGKEDLEKAIHFIEKLKELEYGPVQDGKEIVKKRLDQISGNPYANITDAT